MTDKRPDRPPAAGLAHVLELRRNVSIGLAVGVVVGALAVVYRVVLVGQVPGSDVPLAFFLALGFVLLVSLAALVAIGLTAFRVWRLARTFEATTSDAPESDTNESG